jgi:ring-1,2-phenylacetyl-CoA epoxidase subunit PaaC
MGEKDPDTIAFTRNASDFRCCHLTEYPNGEYEFSLMRNFLFNHSEHIRFEMLCNSSLVLLSKLSKKYRGEIKYHVMHSDTWVKRLGNANEESHTRMQNALNNTFDLALGIFEESDFADALRETNVFEGEKVLQMRWLLEITPVLESSSLVLPELKSWKPAYGGRKGQHTEHLQPLLDEMGEVFRLDPNAEW